VPGSFGAPNEPYWRWIDFIIDRFDSNLDAFTGAPWETRRARFWSVLAGGIAGDGFGSRDTPGDNGTGANDWVLVLDTDGPAAADRCGTITPSGLYTPPGRAPDGVDCQITATSRSDASVVARLVLRP
jgi:hypothetical protein